MPENVPILAEFPYAEMIRLARIIVNVANRTCPIDGASIQCLSDTYYVGDAWEAFGPAVDTLDFWLHSDPRNSVRDESNAVLYAVCPEAIVRTAIRRMREAFQRVRERVRATRERMAATGKGELPAFASDELRALSESADGLETATADSKPLNPNGVAAADDAKPHGDGDPDKLAPQNPPSSPPAGGKKTKRKRSTVKGESREKLIAALTMHHKYENGSCLNVNPIGVRALARAVSREEAKVSESTASEFFEKEFDGWQQYVIVCRNFAWRLANGLKLLNNEVSPKDLYGRNPPDEGGLDRDD